VEMADLSSCAMCVLAFLTTESLAAAATAVNNSDLDDCLRQDLPQGFTEWNSAAYRQRGCLVINWNILSQTVSVYLQHLLFSICRFCAFLPVNSFSVFLHSSPSQFCSGSPSCNIHALILSYLNI